MSRGDRRVFAGAALLVVAAVVTAWFRTVHAPAAPLFGHVLPHAGPGTPLAVLVALVVIRFRAVTWPWRRLLAGGYLAGVGWILALALVDGWQRGLAGRLTTEFEYLSEVPGVVVPEVFRTFAGRILDGTPDAWTTHVAGHPPGALLVFVGLDRAGLGGGGWAAVACVLVGAAVVPAVAVTVRELGGEPAARAAVPFLVLFPGAVWIGASADGLFAGVAALGLMLLAVGLTRPAPVAALAAGVVLAGCLYLSYGLVLLAPLALAVVLLAAHRRHLGWAVLGALAVVAAVTRAGFWWLDGYVLVERRYYQGLASRRPYGYWVWANLAALVLSAGPVAAVVVRRAVRHRAWCAPVLLPAAALVAVLAADLSGLSKAEVERIWLPFAVWFCAGAALLPVGGRRAALLVQAGTALAVNHLVLTAW